MKSKNSDQAAVKGSIQGALTRVVGRIYDRLGAQGGAPLPLAKEETIALCRRLVYRAIDKPGKTLTAGRDALADGIAALQLKASLTHGELGEIFDHLPLSEEDVSAHEAEPACAHRR